MIRRLLHRSLLAAPLAAWLAGAVCLAAVGALGSTAAHASGGSTPASPAVNAAVQEAVSKAKAGGSAPAEGNNGKAFSKLTGEGEEGTGAEEAQKPAKTNAASSSGAPSTGLVVLVFAAAALLLGGIAFYIVRNARGMAPVAEGLAEPSRARDQAARARKRRAKAKAARAARKRNR
jgi:hypothetical protein